MVVTCDISDNSFAREYLTERRDRLMRKGSVSSKLERIAGVLK